MYYKMIRTDMIHYGFKYKLGLNIDTVPFNPFGSREKGGLYFTTLQYLAKFFKYGDLIGKITIPKDAQVYADPEGDCWKANKINLVYVMKIKDFEEWKNEYFRILAAKYNGLQQSVTNEKRIFKIIFQTNDLLISINNDYNIYKKIRSF